MTGTESSTTPMFNPGKDLGHPTPRKGSGTLLQRAGWKSGPVCLDMTNFLPTVGFDPRTVQPVASRYIN
jgi:hypothetical protein